MVNSINFCVGGNCFFSVGGYVGWYFFVGKDCGFGRVYVVFFWFFFVIGGVFIRGGVWYVRKLLVFLCNWFW